MTNAAVQSESVSAVDQSTASALRFDGVDKSFTVHKNTVQALDSVHFTAKAGQITALIGADGSGKTTFMRLASGLLHPERGQIKVFGADTVKDPAAVRSLIGYMPQRFGLYEDLSVQENLDLYADLQGIPFSQRRDKYDQLLAMGGLEPFTSRLAGRLSGGMKQKLGLICTLLRTPRLLLLDEPTVGVDPVSRQELWSIITHATKENGVSVVISTGYFDEVERCDAFLLLHEGSVLAQGIPEEFASRVDGRVFTVGVKNIDRRATKHTIASEPGVVDALLHGDTVRVVLDTSADPKPIGTRVGAQLQPTRPRFEDAFIDLLTARISSGATSEVHAPEPQRPTQRPTQGAEKGEAEAGNEVIRIEGVTRAFGTFLAVNNVSFDVRRGEVFGLLGANGAGKTTAFRMLCGLLAPTSGTLLVAGVNMRRAPAKARARIGYMSQGFSMYRELSVARNLKFFAGAYGLRGDRMRERIQWAVDEFDLGSVLSRRSDHLSLGYKQRLAFACSLMHEPSILFLDEPTSGVDPLARREFWTRIEELAAGGVTAMVTTHFMEEAEYCDRLVIQVAGRIAASGTPDEIRAQAMTNGHPSQSMEDAFLALVRAQSPGGSS